jgi:integrase
MSRHGGNYWTRAMPRKVRDANLETRTARHRLPVAHKPYFRLIEPGLHLGYRKLTSGPGTWVKRSYNGDGTYHADNLRTADGALVLADDYADADGERVLSFAQAQETARGPRTSRSSYTTGDALDDYFDFLKSDGRSEHSIRDACYRADALIRPKLGSVKLNALTAERLRNWRNDLVKAAPRLRTRKGEPQKYREVADDEDALRIRRASANRTWTTLRAALNHAFSEGKIDSDIAWRKVKPFKKVDAARIRYLTIAEAKRLINASNTEFRPLVQAALKTGCRYSELCRLEVRDFNSDAGTLSIRQSKTGNARHVVLTAEGAQFFGLLTAGRKGHELILRRLNGVAWGDTHQQRPMLEACKAAKITPPVNLHALRHTWASHSIMNGMPLMVVARNLGHVDTRMVEKHYGHLAPSFVTDAVRKSAPKFGLAELSNITSIRGRR